MKLDHHHSAILRVLEHADRPLELAEIGMRTDDMSYQTVQDKMRFLRSHDYVTVERDGRTWLYKRNDE